MTADDDPVGAVEFLARSETRLRILEALVAEGPLSKTDLRERLDASRTTIGRNLTALSERGWIAAAPSTYDVTPTGRWIAEDFAALLDTVRDASRFRPVFDCVDPDAFGFDLRRHEFEITTADPGDPLKMVTRHVETVRQADELRAVMPMTGTQAIKAAHDRITDAGTPTTLVVAPSVADTFRTAPEYRDYVEELQATGSLDLSVTTEEVPFYLGLFADSVEFGLDEDGQPKALLQTESAAVYAWAESEFERYREAATPFADWSPT